MHTPPSKNTPTSTSSFAALLLLACSLFPTLTLAQAPGSLTVTPDRGIAGDYGTWTVTYRVGDAGLATGGALRVQLPDSWHAGDRNSGHPLQASHPARDHYISAHASRPDVRLRTTVEGETENLLVKGARTSLDCRTERYVFVVRVEVVEGMLRAGDTVSVVYGDTSGGSRGMRAGVIATDPEPVLAAVAPGSGPGQNPAFTLLTDPPTIELISGPPALLLASGPSSLALGEPAELHLAVLDAQFNPVERFEGEVRVEVTQGGADVPGAQTLTLEPGRTTLPFTPTETGILRLHVEALGGLLEARVNPMRVTAEPPARRIYWGDLHSHGRHSHDGVGRDPFAYARHVAGLDFYALTDHSLPTDDDGCPRGLGPHLWEAYTAATDRHNAPGAFATLHAYEASFGAPYGHHNVFFRGRPGPLLVPERNDDPGPGSAPVVSLPELWRQLEAGEALTIPHHTGKFPSPVRWEPHDPERRRNFEIYSGHGLSEAYDPDHPLAFEQSDFTSPSRSVDGPQFAHDAWIAGLELSTIAASDDHRAQPGKPHFGLAAVAATELTREAVFDALYERRTYGTTGARILLDFSVNGAPMGQTVETDGPPVLRVEAHGTDVIDVVEILRYTGAGPGAGPGQAGGFRVAYTIRPESMDFTWSRTDPDARGDAIYYVRLRQREPVLNRAAMAWSSPVWVRVAR